MRRFSSTKVKEFRNSVFSVEIDMPQTRSSSERAFKDLQAYFTTAMKRRAVEISERRLTPEEKKQFDQAKAIEVNNFISARAFEALAPEHKFSREDVINMRWILTWKVKPDGIARKIEQYFRAIWIQNMKQGNTLTNNDSFVKAITTANQCGQRFSHQER